MSNLTMPADLAEIINVHRALFGGFTMMADDNPADGANPQPNQDADKDDPKPPDAGKDEPLKEPGLKALQAERDARAKAEADLAALKKQIEDADKTAEQKAADALKAAEQTAATALSKALRYEVASAKEGDELKRALALAPRLVGNTKEELAADLDKLLTELGAPKPAAPKPDPSAGHAGDPKPKTLADAIGQHYNA